MAHRARSEASQRVLEHPLDLGSQRFADHKYEIYAWLREQAPVYRARVSLFRVHLMSRYDDCMALLKDPRFVRNRTTATGGGRLPFPMPRSVALLVRSMIVEDEPEHQRLRGLVNSAFKPRAIARIEERIERLTHELLDAAAPRGRVDLMQDYCLPIPVTVIRELRADRERRAASRFGGLRIRRRYRRRAPAPRSATQARASATMPTCARRPGSGMKRRVWTAKPGIVGAAFETTRKPETSTSDPWCAGVRPSEPSSVTVCTTVPPEGVVAVMPVTAATPVVQPWPRTVT